MTIRVVLDAHDGYIVTLAREHAVDVIVSGDKNLLEWQEQGPPVVTPGAFEHMLTPGRPA